MIENRVKENCILCNQRNFCWTYEEDGNKATCGRRWQLELKTLDGWQAHGGDFSSYVERGDKTDAALYDYFLSILPPFELKPGIKVEGVVIESGFQNPEAVVRGIDCNNAYRDLYDTFGVIAGEHYYLGLSFRGEVKSRYRLAERGKNA